MLAIMMSRDGSIVGTLYWVRNANMDWIYLYLFSAANTFIILKWYIHRPICMYAIMLSWV
jgi:hypothetical protein